ncbi:NAD-dependent epimerase/dehydratase family protein, partial [bacterium]|nr:NAD-dependent epimerase/dehydratase family protein [bacterium]
MKRIIVTGSTGFVGRHLVPKLLNESFKVLEITRNKSRSRTLFGDKTLKLGADDLDFKHKVSEFRPNIIVHLASYLTSSDKWGDVEKLINVNIRFVSKLLDAVSPLNLSLFINTGTFAEYSNGDGILKPSYYYAATKTAARFILDYYSNTYKFKQTTIVPYTIYGGRDSQKKIIDIIYGSTKTKESVDLSPGEQILDF